MLIHVLGSAAGGGFPQWNCNCANCAGLRAGRVRARARTQSSIAVSADGTAWALINASPDIRAQIAAFPALQPARAIRDTGIAAVIVVDSQIDHCTGLLMLREHRPLQLYSTSVVLEDLSTGLPLVNVLKHYCGVEHHPLIADGRTAFTVAGVPGLRFTALPIHSKAPPYSPHRHDPHPGDNIALLIEDVASGRRAFYAPGLGAVDGAVREAMTAADCLLVDGTFWRDDEMAVAGISSKRARDMGHLPQSGADGMIVALAAFAGKRRILIHINNTNPILDEDSPERAELDRAGIEVAVDGLDLAI